ncbi:cytochrome B562 [Ursidibacter maritimus]|uniref:Cytochrome B562 n=1 Tax=Ursidibacter maritimus TaxID=1331689 RepID=A0A949SZX4_9PAST|nr:cytochrome b562 [Ursidibacter maritimus]KAE9538321.1 cytochrome B562 [Ursidibacter maritimus]MBV6523632.1 cytochrome B562 [Ursidibacter maritimus]MBV6525525.1 cytochrome B562 [Ursidibacter maritimus]MBV6527610.1 cytochrome B562 [Ursidibacter maritimus]MBV6529697.1 cytochrome B562 [Ursidibacter maritimus]
MNKAKQILFASLIAVSTIAAANVSTEMRQMGRNVNGLLRADSVESFQQSATEFLVAAKKAQEKMPSSLDGDQEKFKGYQKGIQEVIDVVEQANQSAKDGKLDEAKTTVEKLNQLKKIYHSEYK